MIPNTPQFWMPFFPRVTGPRHKYDRGYCIVVAGAKLTGAARLVAESCARVGAGLTTIIAPAESAPVFRAACPAHIMVEDETADYQSHLSDPRRNVLVLGPGYGQDDAGVMAWLAARGAQKLVLDADGLNALSRQPEGLALLHKSDILTPHAGEYARLFGDLSPQEAALQTKCILVLKGPRTIITDGAQIVINDHASPYLASAGTGDVLAGMIGGLIAQGMPSFQAACAAVWIHGQAGIETGVGLVASDLPNLLPAIIRALLAENT
jgi:hydroxyethylthiazole kinase-like uncharacterized protein yjeF